MTRHLLDALATTGPLAALFDDHAVLQALLDVEAGLARAQAETGVIPASAAAAIAGAAARADQFDAAAIAQSARRSASIAVPLVEVLTAHVTAIDSDASRFVHWGATSQDIVDTAMSLLVVRAREALNQDAVRLGAALRALSDRHRGDVMVARTLLQPAVPTTFGLKVAVWFRAQRRSWRRLDEAAREAAGLQFGGAGGTLASMGPAAPGVAQALARQLGLAPAVPWQNDRDRIAALVTACGLYCGALGKMARDTSLLMQFEVGESTETGGGSSSMPHKRNPAGCAIVLAAATRLPGLVASAMGSLVQEHERSVGGWHAEWPILADALQTTGSALDAACGVAETLTIDAGRMRANLVATRGAVVSEWLSMVAARTVGRDEAKTLTRTVLARVSDHISLAIAVDEIPELRASLSADERRVLQDPSTYLGQAERFRQRLLEED